MKLIKPLLSIQILFAYLLIPSGISAQGNTYPGPFVVGNGVRAPVVVTQPLPAYTAEARAAGVEGIVLIQAIVRKDGTVDSFKILKGLGYGLDESAINTIATRWRFKPGTYDGNDVDVQANIEVSFRLFRSPAEIESLRPFNMRIQLVDAHWASGDALDSRGSGYGNAFEAGVPRGFSFDCSCNQKLGANSNYPARWVQPDSRIEIALGYDANTARQKSCELEVIMHNAVFAMRDGQVVTYSPPGK